MKNILLCVLFILLLSYPASADNPDYVEGDVLVSIQAPAFSNYDNMITYSQALMDQAEAFASRFELQIIGGIRPSIAITTGVSIITLRSEYKSTEELIKELSTDPDVLSVQKNLITYFDPPIPGEEDKDSEEEKNSREGSSGCNAGYGSISFLMAALMSPVINKVFGKKRVQK